MLTPKRNRTLIVGPKGQVVMVRANAKLKAGWRYATDADLKVDVKAKIETRKA